MNKKNDVIDERLRASLLFDFYGELLNENQKSLCEKYLLDDLSLSEIADGEGISRQGVHDKIKRSIKQMEVFEESLGLIKKNELIDKEVLSFKIGLEKIEDGRIREDLEERINQIVTYLNN